MDCPCNEGLLLSPTTCRLKEGIYRRCLLAILLVVLAFNYVDRLALGLLLQSIKADLQLSDTQLGLLTGFAFALFYSVMGIPIARWADRGNRVTIITLTTALWSAMVALCGTATSFMQLLLIRIGVAVGEAGHVPPAHSLIADHFTRVQRPRAVAIYMLGGPLAMFIGYFGAGWLNELYGWRMTFVILGVPGVALAVLAALLLRDPRNDARSLEGAAASTEGHPGILEVGVTLWSIPTFRHLLLAFSLIFFFGFGMSQWLPAFFIRSHGLQTGAIGLWFTVIYGLTGLFGTYSGGVLASRYAANKERLQLRVLAILFGTLIVIRPLTYLVPGYHWAFALMAPAALVLYIGDGPLFAVIQTLVPPRMRAMSIAIMYLFANLIGMGLGPLVTGALSDAFRSWAGEDSLRYALVALSPGYLLVVWVLWRASQTVTRDLQLVRETHGKDH